MGKRKIFITKFDKKRLEDIIDDMVSSRQKDRLDLETLRAELKQANVVESQKIPPTVVTMNSKIQFRDLDSGEDTVVSLVFPIEANYDDGRLSVTSPIGTAMLGYAEGETIEWTVPAGKRRIKIEKVLYQPEAAGHFDR